MFLGKQINATTSDATRTTCRRHEHEIDISQPGSYRLHSSRRAAVRDISRILDTKTRPLSTPNGRMKVSTQTGSLNSVQYRHTINVHSHRSLVAHGRVRRCTPARACAHSRFIMPSICSMKLVVGDARVLRRHQHQHFQSRAHMRHLSRIIRSRLRGIRSPCAVYIFG